MPKYSVIVTRDTTESVEIEVEADTPEEAEEKAREESYSANYYDQWEPDDTPNASADHYTNGAEEI